MTLIQILEILRALFTALTLLCFSYQAVYLILPFFRKARSEPVKKPTRYAILIAARNEEAVLPHLLDSIHAQDYPKELITTYVIADNCTDNTAAVAEAKGARVYRRFNTCQVGKGYALNFLLNTIRDAGELERFDAFLIFDADNLLEPDYISRMNGLVSQGYESFCGYRNSKNFGTNWLSSGYALWYLHESAHLNQSRMMLGTSCAVNGTGFGFTRQLLERLGGWNFTTLTEDIEFGTWCATHGVRIGYCHDAVLYDEQPTSFRVSTRQRTRWIQGGLQVSLHCAANYLQGMLRGGRTGWASFEFATLSLWGCLLGSSGFLCGMMLSLLSGDLAGLAGMLFSSCCAGYGALFVTGTLTMATEHRRIRATRAQKLRSLVTFPIFRLSYIPIAILALFIKFEWKPIAHTVAIPVSQLQER